MSLLNVIIEADRVHVLTDTVATSGDMIVTFVDKFASFPDKKIIIACRGSLLLARAALELFANDDEIVGHFDHMKQALPQFIKNWFASRDDTLGDNLELVVAGWRDSRPAAFYLHTSQESPEGAWVAHGIEDGRISPSSPAVNQMCSRIRGEVTIVQMVALAELQRLEGGIGGHLQLTTLTADGITSDIIHRWPDKVFEPIAI
jgi:hypothetical protein